MSRRSRWKADPSARCLALIAPLALLVACEEPEAEVPVVTIAVDVGGTARPISEGIYGINEVRHAEAGVHTLVRVGGTRASTYNWENNASNAGHDPPRNQNDAWMHPTEEPAGAAIAALDAAARLGGAAMITVPMIGHVAADRRADGDVSRRPDFLATRFVRTVARCDEDEPVLDDGVVCQHAFVRRVRREAEARGVPVYIALDNEPGGWPITQPLLRRDRPVRYAELITLSEEHARMIREEAPGARITGPVSFGWASLMRLGGAPDARGHDFVDVYLSAMRARGGLVDLLDLHWYPAMQVDGVRVAGPSAAPAVARVRMQAPRSLWDPSYVEPSWITEDSLDDEAIRLLPRLREIIERESPGVGIAITEWAYGGGAHPSGAVAVADALGAFGRYGVDVAAYWPLMDQGHDYAFAAFRMYRRVDGAISFGDRSIDARSDTISRVGAWASLGEGDRLTMVLVHRADRHTHVRFDLLGADDRRCRVFVLDREASRSREKPAIELTSTLRLSPRSVTTLICE